MTDEKTTVADLKARVLAFADERDWHRFHSPKNLSMALAAEAAALMEHFLWTSSGREASAAVLEEEGRRGQVEEELADVIIYALEFANVAGVDIAAAVAAKMETNARRYPVEKARGSARKYNEL